MKPPLVDPMLRAAGAYPSRDEQMNDDRTWVRAIERRGTEARDGSVALLDLRESHARLHAELKALHRT